MTPSSVICGEWRLLCLAVHLEANSRLNPPYATFMHALCVYNKTCRYLSLTRCCLLTTRPSVAMSQPATPRTTIPTITTETHRSSPGYVLQYSNSGFTPCRIEESQRTIFLPPDSQLQLHTHAGDNPVNVTIIPENGSYVPRRTRSLELLSPVNQPQVEPPSPSCSHHSTASFAPRSPLSAKPPITRHVPPATPTSFSRRSWTPRAQPTRILFYHKHDPHYGFTNFSPHPVMYKGKRYPTSEHLFQSFKV